MQYYLLFLIILYLKEKENYIKDYINVIILVVGDDIMAKSKVYFTRKITSSGVVEMFKILNKQLPGKVAVKVHSGEAGNQNY